MKVVVTGGAGFIGSHLVDHLYSEGYDIVVVDSLHTGAKENIKSAEYSFFNNISDFLQARENVDAIFHLGMPSSSPMYKKDRLLVCAVVRDALNILEYAIKHGTKVIVASTSSLYNGNDPPYKENAEIKVTDFYTEARYYVERLCELYSKMYGLRSVCLRLFSVYGEREEKKGEYANLASQFTWAFIKGEKPVIYGDGTQTRDFIYVGDVVKAFEKALEYEGNYGIFNVGTGRETSLNELITILQKIFIKEIEPKYVENPIKNYVYRTLADTEKAENELGFKAKVSLEEGLRKIKDYYEKIFG